MGAKRLRATLTGILPSWSCWRAHGPDGFWHDAQVTFFDNFAKERGIEGDVRTDAGVQVRVLAAYHDERERRRKREKEEAAKKARPWKELSDDQLVNHWNGAIRRSRTASTPDEVAAAQRKIAELHTEAAERGTTLKALDAWKRQSEGRGR